jgi:hypothetical protein
MVVEKIVVWIEGITVPRSENGGAQRLEGCFSWNGRLERFMPRAGYLLVTPTMERYDAASRLSGVTAAKLHATTCNVNKKNPALGMRTGLG